MECTEGGASKFWRCAVSGNKTTITFGKIGASGSGQVKTHKSPGDALKFLATMSAQKKAKGYASHAKSSGSSAKVKATNASAMKAEKTAMKATKATAVTERAAPRSSSAPPAKRRKGGTRADSRVPNAASFDIVGDCTVKLNQTNIGGNNNKFYIIQALKNGSKYYVWNRWGRVGEDGLNKLMPCANEDAAIKEFEKKFREKTSNQWASRDSFKPVSGKYSIVETDDSGGADDQAPMGKLTEAQIVKGQAVLKEIQGAMKKNASAMLDTLSSKYYTLIPHDFGRKRPPSISNAKMLQTQIELLKFYLRMGFEKVEDVKSLSPISGVLDLPLPKSLKDAATGLCSSSEIKESEDQGASLAKKQAGSPKTKMDPSLYGAIMLYTSNAIYQSLNKTLRDENRGKLKKYFKYLRLLFEAFDTLPQKRRTLWRGLGVDLSSNKQYAVGKTVTWWGVSSCTSDAKVARNFAAGCGGGSTVITVDAKSSCDIAAISFFSNEKESLLRPGTQLKVVSNTKKGSIAEIHLQEVGLALG